MTTSISSVLVDCLRSFNGLASRPELAIYTAEVPTNLWTDELGRLRVWAANIGAHQTGQSSLDYRLRDASHIKAQTVKLLERLRRTLSDAEEFLAGGAEEDDNLSADDADETELQQVYRAVVDTTDCLFQLSMIIRRPAQHDKLVGTKKLDATLFEPFDRQHVANKHPKAGSIVVDRLGAAISRRRAALKYRERHHAKLAKGIERAAVAEPGDHGSAADLDERRDAVSTLLSLTVATEFEEKHIDYEETASNSGASQTSYAPSLWESNDRITVPSIPKDASYGKAFECPYCFFIVTVSNRRSWARHVFKDLMPYVCVFPDCNAPNRLYDSRHEWFHHLRTKHVPSFDPSETDSCPLRCGDAVPVVSLERHLGRHLEELALFALPRVDTGDEEGSNESQASIAPAPGLDEASSASSSEAIASVEFSSASQTNVVSDVAEAVGTVHKVEVLPRVGATIDVSSKVAFHKGDRIVLCGTDGPFATNVQEILPPGSLAKMEDLWYKAGPHTKLWGPYLEKAVVDSPLFVVRPIDNEENLMSIVREWQHYARQNEPADHVSEADGDDIVEVIEEPDHLGRRRPESPGYDYIDPEEEIYFAKNDPSSIERDESVPTPPTNMGDPADPPKLREHVQLGYQVIVKGLALTVTSDDLKEFMRQAGEVLSAFLRPGSRLIPRQTGIVVYATREQAQRAIQTLNDQFFMGLPVNVMEGRSIIIFIDAMKRKYHIPWGVCKKWKKMEGFVRQVFAHIDNLRDDVAAGLYDLLGPDGQIIRPQDWEDVIEPGMQITMALWPKVRRSDMLWDEGGSNLTEGPMHKRKVPSVASDQESEQLEGLEEDVSKDFDLSREQPSSSAGNILEYRGVTSACGDCRRNQIRCRPDYQDPLGDLADSASSLESDPPDEQVDARRGRVEGADEGSAAAAHLSPVVSAARTREESVEEIHRTQPSATPRDLVCSICIQVLYQPVTLLDCLHTFCGSCLKEWFSYQTRQGKESSSSSAATRFTCPRCRARVNGTTDNPTIETMLDTFLAANPGADRTAEGKTRIAQDYKPGDMILTKAGNRPREVQEDLGDTDRQRSLEPIENSGIAGPSNVGVETYSFATTLGETPISGHPLPEDMVTAEIGATSGALGELSEDEPSLARRMSSSIAHPQQGSLSQSSSKENTSGGKDDTEKHLAPLEPQQAATLPSDSEKQTDTDAKGGPTRGIPPGARRTKISRAMVNPEALEEANERYEERGDHIILLRVATRDEILALAERTKEIRLSREPNYEVALEERRWDEGVSEEIVRRVRERESSLEEMRRREGEREAYLEETRRRERDHEAYLEEFRQDEHQRHASFEEMRRRECEREAWLEEMRRREREHEDYLEELRRDERERQDYLEEISRREREYTASLQKLRRRPATPTGGSNERIDDHTDALMAKFTPRRDNTTYAAPNYIGPIIYPNERPVVTRTGGVETSHFDLSEPSFSYTTPKDQFLADSFRPPFQPEMFLRPAPIIHNNERPVVTRTGGVGTSHFDLSEPSFSYTTPKDQFLADSSRPLSPPEIYLGPSRLVDEREQLKHRGRTMSDPDLPIRDIDNHWKRPPLDQTNAQASGAVLTEFKDWVDGHSLADKPEKIPQNYDEISADIYPVDSSVGHVDSQPTNPPAVGSNEKENNRHRNTEDQTQTPTNLPVPQSEKRPEGIEHRQDTHSSQLPPRTPGYESSKAPPPPEETDDSQSTTQPQRRRASVSSITETQLVEESTTGIFTQPDLDPTRPGAGKTPVVFEWRSDGQDVFVTGTFTNWENRYRLLPQQRESGSGKVGILHLRPGTHHFRFLVDDEMYTSPDLPTAVDFNNMLVNYIEVVAESGTGV